MILDRYNIVDERDLVDAVGKLEQHFAQIRKGKVKSSTSAVLDGSDQAVSEDAIPNLNH
jgi:hypothetical protein